MKRLLLITAVALIGSSSWAAVGTIKSTKGDVKKGEIRWLASSKSYELKSGNAVITLKESDVQSLDVEKPKNLEKLGIDGWKKVIKTYEKLQWDVVAARYLTEAYLNSGRAQDAYDTARIVIASDITAAYKGALAPMYWQSLHKLGKTDQLERCLKKAVEEGDRAMSAEALLMRGDILRDKGGKTPASYKEALVDAYLKVALMYNTPECINQRIEGFEKSAEAFAAMGRATEAQHMRNQAEELKSLIK
jgi:tetratricopeptide (TPR) repeat protein